MTYKTLIPTVNVGPICGYAMRQVFPLAALRNLVRPSASVVIQRDLFASGRKVGSWETRLPDNPATWREDLHGVLDFSAAELTGDEIAYVETSVRSEAKLFSTLYPPSFYSIYTRTGFKPVYSDGALKFANPYIINQIKQFGRWCETYPAILIDDARGYDASILLINPYPMQTVITLEFGGTNVTRRVKVRPMSGLRVVVGDVLKMPYWQGAVFAHGKNRVVFFILTHPRSAPNRIVTIEHSEAFRGALTGQPLTRKVGAYLRRTANKLLDRRSIRERIAAREASRKVSVD